MEQKQKAMIMDAKGMERAITRISFEVIERNKGVRDLAIVGIKRRGYVVAQRIAAKIGEIEGEEIPCCGLDITPYRDDTQGHPQKVALDIPVQNKRVILVDDVMYTGRTVRAAMEAVMDSGRPQSIQLAVMVDRGHRELPLRPDFVGKNLPTSKNEQVRVCVTEYDGEEYIAIEKMEPEE